MKLIKRIKNLNRTQKILSLIILFIVYNFSLKSYVDYYHQNIQNHPIKYAYKRRFNENALVVFTLSCAKKLIVYEKAREKIDIYTETIYVDDYIDDCEWGGPSIHIPIYVLGYELDSQIVRIAYYRYTTSKDLTLEKAYIYARHLHSEPLYPEDVYNPLNEYPTEWKEDE